MWRSSEAMDHAILNAHRDAIDAAGTNGTLMLYSGAQPPTPETPPGEESKLLATLLFARPSAPDAAGRKLVFHPIESHEPASASGLARWFRVADGSGRALFDGNVTAIGGGGIVEIDFPVVIESMFAKINLELTV